MDCWHRFWEKTPHLRKCPHCALEMPEDQMMKHVNGCYSGDFTATRNGFCGEYRGPATKIDHAMRQFKDQNPSQSTNQNGSIDCDISHGGKNGIKSIFC